MATGGRSGADEPLAALLATGLTVTEAAARAKVSARTAYRRLDDPAFRRRVDELKAGLVAATLDRITGAMSEAVDKLRELLAHKDGAIQVRAAVALLNSGIRLREHAELEARIEQLERLMESQQNQPGRART